MRNKDDLKFVFNFSPLMIGSIVVLMVNSLILYSYRFKIVLEKCSRAKLPFLDWFKTAILGQFLNTFATQAGNVYRSVYLKKKHQIPYTHYASSLFSFAWMDTCLNIIYALVTVLMVEAELRIGNFRALHLLLLLAAAIIVIPILLEVAFRLIKFRNRHVSWLHTKLSEMLTISVGNLSDRVYMLKIVLTGIVAFFNTVAIFYVCFSVLEIPITLPALALFHVILRLSTQITITPGNLGIRELVYGVLSEQIHIGMAQGIVVSVVIRILGTCVITTLGMLFGGIELLCHRKDYSKLQQ